MRNLLLTSAGMRLKEKVAQIAREWHPVKVGYVTTASKAEDDAADTNASEAENGVEDGAHPEWL